jgi:uncharacterized protein (DUF2147 family)
MILHEVLVSNHVSYFQTITLSSNSLFQTMKAKQVMVCQTMNMVCQTMNMVCQTMIMVCAELYAQWNNIVIGASGVAWRGNSTSAERGCHP